MNLNYLKPAYMMAEPAIDPPADPPPSDPPSDPPADPPANAFPDTWREDYSAGDEGKQSYLSRYASPADAFNAGMAANQKITSGEFKSTSPYPDKGTEEEQGAWRESNGIPASADKYDIKLADGRVIGEDDQPIIDDFIAHAHAGNMSAGDVTNAVEWYFQNQEKMAEARTEADAELKDQSEDTMRAEWGAEYKANLNRVHGLLATAPEEVKEKFLGARYMDGTPLGSDPDTLRWLIGMALEINPATTLVPGAGDNIAGAISDELAEMQKMMGNKNSDYWKGPKADALQKRTRELIAAQEKMKK